MLLLVWVVGSGLQRWSLLVAIKSNRFKQICVEPLVLPTARVLPTAGVNTTAVVTLLVTAAVGYCTGRRRCNGGLESSLSLRHCGRPRFLRHRSQSASSSSLSDLPPSAGETDLPHLPTARVTCPGRAGENGDLPTDRRRFRGGARLRRRSLPRILCISGSWLSDLPRRLSPAGSTAAPPAGDSLADLE